MNFFKRLTCKHQNADLIRWHWTHGPNGNDPRSIEAEYKCKDCGKICYIHLYGAEAKNWANTMGTYKLV